MSDTKSKSHLDADFYLDANSFFGANRGEALTFDDVTLATLYSEVLPAQTVLQTSLSETLQLRIPVLSADMDTVTESRMAIAMALSGGLGILHCNLPDKEQLHQLSVVKHHVQGMMRDPVTVKPDALIGEVLALIDKKKYSFSTFPVVAPDGKLLGLLPGHCVKPRYAAKRVGEAMLPREQVHARLLHEMSPDPIDAADKFFNEHMGISKLLVVDAQDKLVGLVTISDIEKILQERQSKIRPARDSSDRLVCAASVGMPRLPDGALDRARICEHAAALLERGADALVVSSAHAHTQSMGEAVRILRSLSQDATIIAGNVTSGAGVTYLAECGANAVKVGQGPGSICTTRMVAGVGIPQMTALYVCSQAAQEAGIRIIADGGITKSGDMVKALTLSHAVMCGGMLAGCDESPGEVFEIDGRRYKSYRGMGSLSAMKAGSAARYGHSVAAALQGGKVSAEGVEALKESSGPVEKLLRQMTGGLQSGMGYLGALDLPTLRKAARYIRVSAAGQREAAPHDVVEVKTI